LQRWRVAFGTPIWFGPFRRPSSTFTVSTPMMSRTSSSRQAAPSNLVCQFALNRRHLEYVVTSERDNGVEEITSQQYQDMLNGLSDVPARAPRAASPGNSPRCSSSFPRKKNGDWWRYLLQSALHDAIELERARAATASRKRGLDPAFPWGLRRSLSYEGGFIAFSSASQRVVTAMISASSTCRSAPTPR
jgi:hypothetical protein